MLLPLRQLFLACGCCVIFGAAHSKFRSGLIENSASRSAERNVSSAVLLAPGSMPPAGIFKNTNAKSSSRKKTKGLTSKLSTANSNEDFSKLKTERMLTVQLLERVSSGASMITAGRSHANNSSNEDSQCEDCVVFQSQVAPHVCMGFREIIIAFCLILLIVTTVVGNILVILSVCLYRRMRTFTNVLLVSLATADLLVGSIIMAPAMVYMLRSGWMFGELLCKLWATLDVLLCTASILNLVVISLDRYFAITWPLKYIRKRSKKLACILLVAVYVTSLVICSPPWFIPPWKMKADVLNPISGLPECMYVGDLSYRIYSACGSFFLPLSVMLFVYYKILRVASTREQMLNLDRRGSAKVKMFRGGGNGAVVVNGTGASPGGGGGKMSTASASPYSYRSPGRAGSVTPRAGLRRGPQYVSPRNSPYVASRLSGLSDDECSMLDKGLQFSEASPRDVTANGTNSRPVVHFSRTTRLMSRARAPFLNTRGATIDSNDPRLEPEEESTIYSKADQLDNSSSDGLSSRRCSVVESELPSLCTTAKICHDAVNGKGAPMALLSKAHEYYVNTRPIKASKEKMLYLKERKALKTIGIVVSGFVICWLPFFTCYIIEAILPLSMPPELQFFFLWLGYSNSVLNPLIYTLYNRDFRRCFRDLLTCGCMRNKANQRPSVKLLRRARM